MNGAAAMDGVTLVLAEGASIWYAVAFLVGAGIVALVLKRQSRRSALLDPPRARPEEGLHASMDRLLVELQETSREINAVIDTKTAVLNKLIQDADRRIEELKMLEKSAAAAATPKPAEPARPAPAPAPETDESRRRAALERDILRLADEGRTELEIARLTGVARGEVELVLGLRRSAGDRQGMQP